MHIRLLGAILQLFVTLSLSKTSGQLCSGTASEAKDGNWYCSPVQAITYKNISQAGSYNRTIGVDPSTGLCTHTPVSYSGRGPLTPLFGEVSMHLRGPMNVSQIAVYALPASMSTSNARFSIDPNFLGSSKQKWRRTIADIFRSRSHATSTMHITKPELQARRDTSGKLKPHSLDHTFRSARAVTNTTRVAGKDCRLESQCSPSLSHTHCLAKGASPTGLSTLRKSARFLTVVSQEISSGTSSTLLSTVVPCVTPQPTSTEPSLSLYSATPVIAARAAEWTQIAYYTSTAPAQASGITFLANLGDDQESGTFDYSFGNSLGYVSPDGKTVEPNSTPFSGTLATSEAEIAAFTAQACNNDCEYSRPKSTQYHGWDGESKAFLIEFQMDHDDNTGTDQGLLSDAPAWWFLNAAIPRTLQYGNDKNNIPCSCWSTGCGEFDAFEVLGQGEERAKSTIHRQGNLEGGDSNYFQRPVGKTLKFAVFFYQLNITAVILDDNFAFSSFLDTGMVDSIVAYDPNSNAHSLFGIGN